MGTIFQPRQQRVPYDDRTRAFRPRRWIPRPALLIALNIVVLGWVPVAADEPPAEPPAPPPAAAPAAAPASAPPAAVAEACGACHEAEAKSFPRNPHGKTGVAAWTGERACESCHGSGAAHMESGDKAKIRNPAALTSTEVNELCLSCHSRGEERSHWFSSAHEGRGLSCLTCHKSHHEGEPPPHLFAKVTEFDTCTTCHLRR